jgi:nucleotide-binding universal stress UspA family protein
MKALIVPVDFSPVSLNAAKFALKLARQSGGKVVLLHAFLSPSAMPVMGDVELTEDGLWDFYSDELKQLVESLEKEEPFVKIEQMQIRGTVTESVSQFTDSIASQMIVMGISGAGKVEISIFGSNTLRVAEQSKIPVLIVPPRAKFNSISDIGLTTDFKNVDKRIPEKKIEEIIGLFGARLHVLHVDYENKNWNEETPLQSGLVESMFQEFHPEYHFINHPDLAEGLSEYAEKNSIDLLIAIKGEYNWLQKLFHKDHVKQLAIHSRIPLLIINPA